MKKILISGSFNILHPGHLRLFRFAKKLGNKLSFAVAMDICPVISIHPFKTPKPETITPTATKYPPYSPPIVLAASAKGAGDFCKTSIGKIPNKTTVPRI